MSRARGCAPTAHGFALVEVISVLAVVLLLTGIAVPMISGFVQDGRRARAEDEVKVLADALKSFYKDVGVWPARSADGNPGSVYVLCSGPAVPTSNPFATSHQLTTWMLNARHGDTIENHLRTNTPGGTAAAAYPTSGQQRWRGPYVGTTPLDPWGRPYLATIVAGFREHATDFKRLFVLSAGPNGVIDTSATLTRTTELEGDDIGFLLGQR